MSDTSPRTADLSCISQREPETSVSGTFLIEIENSKLKDWDGLLPGEDFIKKSKYQTLERPKEPKPSRLKEPSRVLLLKPSRRWRLPDLKIRRHSQKKPSGKSSKERKPPLPRSKEKERPSIRTRPLNKRLKTRLPKRPKRRPKRPNDDCCSI